MPTPKKMPAASDQSPVQEPRTVTVHTSDDSLRAAIGAHEFRTKVGDGKAPTIYIIKNFPEENLGEYSFHTTAGLVSQVAFHVEPPSEEEVKKLFNVVEKEEKESEPTVEPPKDDTPPSDANPKSDLGK